MRRLLEKLPPRQIRAAGQEYQRFDFNRMASCGLDGVVNAATGSAHSDHVSLDAWLGDQILKSRVNVAGPLISLYCLIFLRRQLVESRAVAIAEAAQIEGKHVNPGDRQFAAEIVPDLPLPVALVQEQNPGSSLGRCEVGRLQDGAVRCLQFRSTKRGGVGCWPAAVMANTERTNSSETMSWRIIRYIRLILYASTDRSQILLRGAPVVCRRQRREGFIIPF